MSDEAAFRAAILAAPDDATVRLAFADWLEDRSDPRAAYGRPNGSFCERQVEKAPEHSETIWERGRPGRLTC